MPTKKRKTRAKKSDVQVGTQVKPDGGVAMEITFNFPRRGISVKARSMSEARRIAEQQSKIKPNS
jgi:hypothetical protein